MAELAIDTTDVKLSQDGLLIDAYLAKPKEGIYPGILVLQEIFGVNQHIKEVTERIAKLGYVAIAPALFQRQVSNFATGYSPLDVQLGKKYKAKTKASELLSDIQIAINYLKSLTQVKQDSFGCIGFCFGGHVAYLAATLPDLKATASFYGAGIVNDTPGGGLATITLTSELTGTVYVFFGMDDKSIPTDEVDKIEAELLKNNISHCVFRYDGADHGFFCDHRASYNPKAADDAWEHVKQLFSEQLSK